MRTHWALLVTGLAIGAFALGAVACKSSKTSSTSTATQSLETATPISTAPTTPLATTGSGTPSAEGALKATQNATLGSILTDAGGNTLYTFDNDSGTTSACTAACATLWPPLTSASGQPTAGAGVTGTLATSTRADGSTQVTYNGKPVYRYSVDTAPGDTKGDGFASGLWHVVKLS